jgi:unsaturated rhamnogalacturonyl hydrolase
MTMRKYNDEKLSQKVSRNYSRRALLAAALAPEVLSGPALYHPLSPARPPDPAPAGKRIPFGWKGFRLDFDAPVRLAAPAAAVPESPSRFRLAVAVDLRDESVVYAETAVSATPLGRLDVRWAGAFQLFELGLSRRDTGLAAREGIRLSRLAGTEPLLFFAPSPELPAELHPHLMTPGALPPVEEARRRLRTPAVMQQWSWKLGCVLDGLLELGEREAARRLIDMHFPDGRTLVYEDPRSAPADGRVYGVEGVLCFGALARLAPEHPGVELAAEFGRRFEDRGAVSTEGCYTVAYPLAVIARQRRDAGLRAAALAVLRRRREVLAAPEVIWQRGLPGDLHFPNWARGVAWYLLGLVYSMRFLGPERDILDEFRRAARFSLALRMGNGLWPVFADDPHTGVDTSGSAGIAAALAMGARAGWLGGVEREAARQAKQALDGWLTPDGFLTGQAQENKKGEELQRSRYRAMMQLGLGLWAQLTGALSRPATG